MKITTKIKWSSFLEKNLRNILEQTQDSVIGMFEDKSGFIWNVVEKDEYNGLTCITITNKLALQTLHINANEGKLVLFPDNKSLLDMKDEPFVFADWLHEHFPNSLI